MNKTIGKVEMANNRSIKGTTKIHFTLIAMICVVLIIIVPKVKHTYNTSNSNTIKTVVSNPTTKKAFTEKSLSKDIKIAYQTLLETTIFEDQFLGYAGTPSKNVDAFQWLLKEEQADEIFKELLKEGKLAGKLYALCGLYLTDSQYFSEIVNKYKNEQTSVTTFSGCIIEKMKFSDIVEAKTQVFISIPSSKKDIALCKKYSGGTVHIFSRNFHKDIISGYFPSRFRS